MTKEINEQTIYDATELRESIKLDEIEHKFHDAYDGKHGLVDYMDSVRQDITDAKKVKLRSHSMDKDSNSEDLHAAFGEALEAYSNVQDFISNIDYNLNDGDNKVAELCIQFQHLVEGTENILSEYQDLVSLVETLHGKIKELESSKWRVFEKYLIRN